MLIAKVRAADILTSALFLIVVASVGSSPTFGRPPTDRMRQAAVPVPHRLDHLLWDAAYCNDYARFRRVLAHGADPNAPVYFNGVRHTPGNGTTWLMEFAALGDVATVKALLDHGACVNARGHTCFSAEGHGDPDPRRSTALIDACCRSDNGTVIRLLLQHGADVNARDASGNTSLGMTIWQSEWGECGLLLRYGASLHLLTRSERVELEDHATAAASTLPPALRRRPVLAGEAERIQIAVFMLCIRDDIVQLDDAPWFLAVQQHGHDVDPDSAVMRVMRWHTRSAQPASRMSSFERHWRRHHKNEPDMDVLPGVWIQIASIRKTSSASAEVVVNEKVNPLGDSDYGEGDRFLFRVIRQKSRWHLVSKRILASAG